VNDFSKAATLTDLYELTMAAGYFEAGVFDDFTFELSVRQLPKNRSYLVACGIAQALDYLENFRFTRDEINYLRGLDAFKSISKDFFDYLAAMRFDGRVRAVPEGTIVFAEEPIMVVTAPAPVAQIAETYLVNAVNFQTMVASKAARVVWAANSAGRDRPVVDFGSRRAQSAEASVLAARASYIAGCAGTSNVFAGRKLGIPVFGTIAHSWIMSFPSEREAFRRYTATFPDKPVLLIDTYDTVEGAREAARFADKLAAVRLDSGDLARLSRRVRAVLDAAGGKRVKIVASGDLDEYEISRLLAAGAPIDSFGVGTRMVTGGDAPYLATIYKLVQRAERRRGRPAIKKSASKRSLPGAKQLWRSIDGEGRFTGDVIGLEGERHDGMKALLRPVMRGGKRLARPEPVEKVRRRCRAQLDALAPKYKKITRPARYPVRLSRDLTKLCEKLSDGMRK